MSRLYHVWHEGELIGSYNSIRTACARALRGGGLGSRDETDLAAGDQIKGWKITIGKSDDPERRQSQ